MSRKIIGLALAGLGLAVFAVRLRHAGPYFPPEGGNLAGALLAIVCGLLWTFDPIPERGRAGFALRAGLLVASLAGLYLAAYATAAEIEEVVVVRAGCGAQARDPMRLWIIDDRGAAWATLGREKAIRHGLSTLPEVELLRGGETRCLPATLLDDARVVEHVSLLREEKYVVERIAVALGIFDEDRFLSNVALRMDVAEPR